MCDLSSGVLLMRSSQLLMPLLCGLLWGGVGCVEPPPESVRERYQMRLSRRDAEEDSGWRELERGEGGELERFEAGSLVELRAEACAESGACLPCEEVSLRDSGGYLGREGEVDSEGISTFYGRKTILDDPENKGGTVYARCDIAGEEVRERSYRVGVAADPSAPRLGEGAPRYWWRTDALVSRRALEEYGGWAPAYHAVGRDEFEVALRPLEGRGSAVSWGSLDTLQQMLSEPGWFTLTEAQSVAVSFNRRFEAGLKQDLHDLYEKDAMNTMVAAVWPEHVGSGERVVWSRCTSGEVTLEEWLDYVRPRLLWGLPDGYESFDGRLDLGYRLDETRGLTLFVRRELHGVSDASQVERYERQWYHPALGKKHVLRVAFGLDRESLDEDVQVWLNGELLEAERVSPEAEVERGGMLGWPLQVLGHARCIGDGPKPRETPGLERLKLGEMLWYRAAPYKQGEHEPVDRYLMSRYELTE